MSCRRKILIVVAAIMLLLTILGIGKPTDPLSVLFCSLMILNLTLHSLGCSILRSGLPVPCIHVSSHFIGRFSLLKFLNLADWF